MIIQPWPTSEPILIIIRSDIMVTAAIVVLLLCIASSLDTNRYIAEKYPDDTKLASLQAPSTGLIIALALLIISKFS